MNKIIVLDNLTADKIAAGEVIERPASVIKELIENSLDAGAKKIIIDLIGGGIERIKVADDGCGMSRDDCELSIKRHATSKIKNSNDLYKITTLGFRGEALASIASVAKLLIQTKLKGAIEGTEIKAEGGQIVSVLPAGCPEGTLVIVKDLFYNTPARKKYLKKADFERNKVMSIVSKMILARPDVRFEYNEEGKRKLTSPGNGSLIDAVTSIFGSQLSQELVRVKSKLKEIQIEGYIGKPSLTRSSRKYQYIYINGRSVKNLNISYSVESAYGELIPRGRNPVYFLSIYIPFEEVDVNVHPAKMEVRLQNEKEISQAIRDAVREAVFGRKAVAQIVVNDRYGGNNKSIIKNYSNPSLEYEELPATKRQLPAVEFTARNAHHKIEAGRVEEYKEKYENFPGNNLWLEPISQLKQLYILASGTEGLYIIDQHAAHERVLYEQIIEVMKQNKFASQMLATPLALSLSNRQIELLFNYILFFREAGFIFEEFGSSSIILRGLPDISHIYSPETVLIDMLDFIDDNESHLDKTLFMKELASSMACKNAIKAGDKLHLDSMRALLQQLLACENSYSCPHGRPTMLNITFNEINKKLRRSS